MGFLKENRLTKLNDVTIYQMQLLVTLPNMNLLKSDDDIKNIDS
jgi:hypothetical protein